MTFDRDFRARHASFAMDLADLVAVALRARLQPEIGDRVNQMSVDLVVWLDDGKILIGDANLSEAVSPVERGLAGDGWEATAVEQAGGGVTNGASGPLDSRRSSAPPPAKAPVL